MNERQSLSGFKEEEKALEEINKFLQ